MTEIEELVRLVLNNTYSSIPCKVVSFNSSSHFAKLTPEVFTSDDSGPLVNVPVLRMVGGKVPVQKGMVIPVFFSKYALGEYLTGTSTVEVGGPLAELQFDRDNAYALPFLFEKEDEKFSMPDKVIFDTAVEFQEEATFKKMVTCEEDISTPNVPSHDIHTHKYSPGSGTPTATGTPE